MSAGTIALTNNSANVTGTGTAFTTDLKAGDFIVVIVGGVTYTLGVKTITSATALTLITAYGGPTATGNAWTAVPKATLVGITAQVAADVAKAIRGLNLDKANWQQVFSGTGTITVTLPDGSTYTGPAWSSITNSLAAKAAKGANSDITSLAGLTTALAVSQGGTGATTAAAARTSLGLGTTSTVSLASMELFASSPFIDFHFNNSQDDYNVRLINDVSGVMKVVGQMDASASFISRQGTNGTTKRNGWNFYWGDDNRLYNWVDTTNNGYVNFTPASDKLLKTDVEYKEHLSAQFLNEVLQWRVASFKYIARGVLAESDTQLGFIANDLVEVSPECIEGDGLKDGFDPLNPENAYHLNQIAMLAKMTGAIQAQQEQIEELKMQVDKLTGGLELNS